MEMINDNLNVKRFQNGFTIEIIRSKEIITNEKTLDKRNNTAMKIRFLVIFSIRIFSHFSNRILV